MSPVRAEACASGPRPPGSPPPRDELRRRHAGPRHGHLRPARTWANRARGRRRERWSSLSDAPGGCYDAGVAREEVLARLRERIVAFAASHLTRDAAEDLAQEVLLLLHEKYAHLERVEDLLPLSLQIVRFKIMSQRRKSVRRGEYSQVSISDIQLPDLDANPADFVERKQMLERLSKAMSGLGERCRELLRLKLQGKTFPEIQKIMGVAAINTIYTWDHRCRKSLLEAMGGSWEPKR